MNKKPFLLPADEGSKGCPWERSNWKTIWDTEWMSLLHKKIIERKIRNNSWPVLMNLVAASVFLK